MFISVDDESVELINSFLDYYEYFIDADSSVVISRVHDYLIER